VKRLFLWFAERHEHAWLKKLDRKDVDLGQGKRMLAKGGKLAASIDSGTVILNFGSIKMVPLVAPEPGFALKGGTAINLFLRDMPRVSVDIDLTYVPIKNRASSLKEIDAAMKRIAAAIEHGVRGAKVNASSLKAKKA
jgi:hypothetical protein